MGYKVRISPVRDPAPCKECKRAIKKTGCHDVCKDYISWKTEVALINEKRKEYDRMPRSRIM